MENKTNKQEIVFRRRRVSFSQIPNTLIDDREVSNIAKMLYITICRWIDAPDYKIYKDTLKNQMGIGSDNTFDKYWKELKDKGYLVQYKMHINGRYAYEYELVDSPQENNTPKNEVLEKSKNNTPIFKGVEKRPGRKLGGYNNTNKHNTNLHYTDNTKKPKNKFNDFPQRNYTKDDLDELEKRKLGLGKELLDLLNQTDTTP